MLEFIFFLGFIVTCLYLPGRLLFSKLRLDLTALEDIFLSTALGIVIFTLISYLLSWVNLEILILPIFLIADFFAIKEKLFFPKTIERLHLWPLIATGVMSFIFSLKMLITGQWGNSILIRHDDNWHLALINELKVHFPPDNPGFADIPLKGYHFFYNFFAAKISNIFLISPISLHNHLIPLFVAFMWGLGVYALLFKWTKKSSAGLWAVFLTMYGGSFAFILFLQGYTNVSLDNGLGFSAPIWSLYNPPLAISILIIVACLFIVLNYLQDRRLAWLLPLALCIGMVSMFKVYAGIILFSMFSLLVVFELYKKNYKILLALTAVAFLSLGTFGIFLGGSGSLIFFPFWGPERLLQSFDWFNYDNKIYVYGDYVRSGSKFIHGLIGLIFTYSYGLILFILGNLGTRLFGVVALFLLIRRKQKIPSFFSFLIFLMVLVSIIIPLLFIQTGKVFEIIQMAQYYLFLVSLLAAIGFAILFDLKFNKIAKYLLLIAVLILTIPHILEVFPDYVNEIKGYQSINSPFNQTMIHLAGIGKYEDIIIELPFKEIEAEYINILGWYHNTSTPKITALANKRSYFNYELIDFPNLDIRARINFLTKIIPFVNDNYESPNSLNETNNVARLLKEKKIKYVYSTYELRLSSNSSGIVKIYQKENNFLYKVTD